MLYGTREENGSADHKELNFPRPSPVRGSPRRTLLRIQGTPPSVVKQKKILDYFPPDFFLKGSKTQFLHPSSKLQQVLFVSPTMTFRTGFLRSPQLVLWGARSVFPGRGGREFRMDPWAVFLVVAVTCCASLLDMFP